MVKRNGIFKMFTNIHTDLYTHRHTHRHKHSQHQNLNTNQQGRNHQRNRGAKYSKERNPQKRLKKAINTQKKKRHP